MAIDPLATWRSTLAALPKVADTSWAANFAGWVADRVVNITTNPANLTLASPLVFVFNEATFATQLIALTPVSDALSGITGFANAWETAILTTVFPATLNVAPGAFIPPSSPATIFSSVTSVVLTPASIAAAKAKIIELASAPPVSDVNDSEFPVKFRDAFLLLKINVTGLNSVSPTPGPLTASNVPLI